MDRFEIQPQESADRGETSENTETRALEDATFEPAACLEGMGDYQQAEAIQTSLGSVMASLAMERSPDGALPERPEQRDASRASEGSGKEPGGDRAVPISIPGVRTGAEAVSGLPIPLPEVVMPGRDSHQEGPFETGGEDDDDRDNITPINLPGVQSVAGEEIGWKNSAGKEPAGAVETPLPDTAGEAGYKEQVGTLPVPLPHPAEEIGAKGTEKGTEGVAEIPLPGTGGETGYKEQIGTLPMPVPRPDMGSGEGGEVGLTEEGAAIDQVVARTEGALGEMSESFNLQYLMLQNKISHENRQFSMPSNMMKTDYDTGRNSINNIR